MAPERKDMKKLLIILLFFTLCLGSIILASESRMSVATTNGTVTIDAEEVTVNNSEDIKEYLIGIKP